MRSCSVPPQLTHRITGHEVARYSNDTVHEGHFRGEEKWGLHIRPTTLNVDLIVLTFVILEKRRRDKARKEMQNNSRADTVCEGGTEMGCA